MYFVTLLQLNAKCKNPFSCDCVMVLVSLYVFFFFSFQLRKCGLFFLWTKFYSKCHPTSPRHLHAVYSNFKTESHWVICWFPVKLKSPLALQTICVSMWIDWILFGKYWIYVDLSWCANVLFASAFGHWWFYHAHSCRLGFLRHIPWLRFIPSICAVEPVYICSKEFIKCVWFRPVFSLRNMSLS